MTDSDFNFFEADFKDRDGFSMDPFTYLSLRERGLTDTDLNIVSKPVAKNEILTDISTFVNSDQIISGKIKLDALGLFDLDCMLLSIILKENIRLIQPFHKDYKNEEFLKWAEDSAVTDRLRGEGILRIAAAITWDQETWSQTGVDYAKWSLEELKKFYSEDKATRISLGIEQKVGDYANYYRKMYSPELMSKDTLIDALYILLYRTNLCVKYSKAIGVPYLPHSLKLPIIQKSLESLIPPSGSAILKKMLFLPAQEVKDFEQCLGFSFAKIRTPPLFSAILDDIKEPMDILDKALELRKSRSARNFREWTSNLDNAIEREDMDQIKKAIEEINGIELEFSQDLKTKAKEAVGYSIHLLFSPASIGEGVLKKGWQFWRKARLTLLRNTAMKAAEWGQRVDEINNVFDVMLSSKDLGIYSKLSGS